MAKKYDVFYQPGSDDYAVRVRDGCRITADHIPTLTAAEHIASDLLRKAGGGTIDIVRKDGSSAVKKI
ncbi:hypothetical protein [Treponema zioleckii]|uniref:hypothetical protein n=1 Tax=Treponema zioleckii TaxID=331680 RepID=UPI00168BE2F0|nr:hypothetical protein [Treponema zioleckii]